MSYNVGQIVYLLSKKDLKVFPAQVIEEIKRKTIGGETISYVVMLPDKNRSEVPLDELNVESFTSISAASETMMENAKSQIGAILERAKEISRIFDTATIHEEKEELRNENTENESSEIVKIDLGNGQTGRVDISKIGG